MAEAGLGFMEDTPAAGPSHFSMTVQCPPQTGKDSDSIVKVKEESGEDMHEAKDSLLKEIMGISDADDDASGPGERLRCAECHYTTTNDDLLVRHVRKVHRGQNPFQCYMCEYSTYNKSLFEEHVRIHQGIKPFKCSYCDYCSASKKNTKKHELIHRPDNPLRCTRCPFIARHHRSLLCHTKTHDEETRSVPCDISDKEEKEPEASDVIIKCEFCGDKFKNTKAYAGHRKRRRNCTDCNTVICSKQAYAKHMLTKHKKHASRPVTYHCSVCTYCGSSAARMLLHLIHHPQRVRARLDLSVLRKYRLLPAD